MVLSNLVQCPHWPVAQRGRDMHCQGPATHVEQPLTSAGPTVQQEAVHCSWQLQGGGQARHQAEVLGLQQQQQLATLQWELWMVKIPCIGRQ